MPNKTPEVSTEKGENMETVEDLIKRGILNKSVNAAGNPERIDFPRINFGIANKDYPARTPLLWNSVYENLGIAERNIRLFGDPGNMAAIFKAFKNDPRYVGGDVGVGFKDGAWKIVDELDSLAEAMQSINIAVKTPEGRLKGYNTDGLGYVKSLEEKFRKKNLILKSSKIVVLGGGGTANSIAFSLVASGANVVILNRTVVKAMDLAKRINEYFQKQAADFGPRDRIADEVKEADAVISAIDDPSSPLYEYSALGLIELPMTPEAISKNIADAKEIMRSMRKTAVISDVMLQDKDTATIREAKGAGFEVLDGRPMVLNQAIEAFWLVNQEELKAKNVTKEQVAEVMERATSKN